jgi:nicotinamidase-related amidase
MVVSVNFAITPEKTAMLVVDMQNSFVQEGAVLEVPHARAMVPRLNRLLDVCRAHKIVVIYLHHVLQGGHIDAGRLADLSDDVRNGKINIAGTTDVEIYEGIKPRHGDLVLAKPLYSSFHGTNLDGVLRTMGIDTVIISGTVTNICCESTARDAFSLGYKVVFLSDGNATVDSPDMGFGPISADDFQRVTLIVMATNYAQVSSIGQVVGEIEWTRTAGS